MLQRIVSGLALAMLVTMGAQAADHREAPSVNLRPAADLADLYVFKAPDNAAKLVLIMTVNPNSDPDFAASYAFDPTVLYRFSIDTTGDARFENRIDFLFSPVAGGFQRFRTLLNGREIANGPTTRGSSLGPVEQQIIVQNGVKVFAGPVDDPFYFDGVGFQRFLAGTGGFRGEDSFGGFNVSAIAIELPTAMISGGSNQLQVEAFTFTSRPPEDPRFGARNIVVDNRKFEQFERTGVPTVATALVPASRRDEFNQIEPARDIKRFGGTIVSSLQRLGTSPENIAILGSVALPDTIKIDITAPSGFPNGRLPADDVIDTILSLVLNSPVSDGVDANDKAFETSFPYLALPHLPSLP